jgi:hypothetical protein
MIAERGANKEIMIIHNVVGTAVLDAVHTQTGMPLKAKLFAIPLGSNKPWEAVWFFEGEGGMRMNAKDPAGIAKRYWELAKDCSPGEMICLPGDCLNSAGDLIQAIRMARPAGLSTQAEWFANALKSQ